MSDENQTHVTGRERFASNKRAFTDVFGDPFAKPEPVTGHYQSLKSRGPVAAMKNNFDEGKATRNPASPNIIDFFCDVERVVADTLTQSEVDKLMDTYIYELGEGIFTEDERSNVEQQIGRIFRAKGISPVSRYFKSTRQKIGEKRRK